MLLLTLDFAIAIQLVRQVEQMQARTFECAKVQVAIFCSFGLQHGKEFNVLLGAGG